MSIGAIQIQNDGSGNGVVSVANNGVVVVDPSDDDGCCCKNNGGATPANVCGNDEGCGFFCFPEWQQYSHCLLCGCPCPGNRAYPQAFDVKFSGATPLIGVKLYDSPGGSYQIITGLVSNYLEGDGSPHTPPGTGVVAWDGCGFWGRALYDTTAGGYATIDSYDSDGTFTGTSHQTWSATQAGGVPADAPVDLTDYTKILAFGGTIGGISINGVPGGFILPDSSVKLDRCGGGIVPGIIVPDDQGQTHWASPGIFTVTPRCRNCDGSAFLEGALDVPMRRCGDGIQVEFTLNGTGYVVNATGSDAGYWHGENEDLSFATITAIDGLPDDYNCCVKGVIVTDADGDMLTEQCWKLEYGVGSKRNVVYAKRACPPTSGWLTYPGVTFVPVAGSDFGGGFNIGDSGPYAPAVGLTFFPDCP